MRQDSRSAPVFVSRFPPILRMYSRQKPIAACRLTPERPVTADIENRFLQIRVAHYARSVNGARSVEWDIERDVLRGRSLDFSRKFLPDGLSLIDRLEFLRPAEALRLSQLQGRTYAALLARLERVIGATVLLRARVQVFDDRTAVESLVRFANDELKHRELFSRLELLMGDGMAAGYALHPNTVQFAAGMLDRSAWSLLALACQVELVAQAHYEQAFESHVDLCPLFKDVFRFHGLDERQHALLDELEWTAVHNAIAKAERDQAVDDFIALIATFDGVLRAQARADAHYYLRTGDRRFSGIEASCLESTLLAATRWQFIVSGMQHVHFRHVLTSLTTAEQRARITAALQSVSQA